MRARARLGLALVLAGLACERAQEDSAPIPDDPVAPEADNLAPATTPEPVAAKPTAPPPIVPHGFALVRAGARLRIDPASAEPSLELSTGQAGPGFVFAAAGRSDELVTLESIASSSSRGCERTLWPLTQFRLVLYAAESDLVNVTTRRLDAPFADGTRVVVLPGATVVREGQDGEVEAGGLALRLAVPVDAVGRYYEPDEVGFPQRTRTPLGEGGEPLRYGDGHAIADESKLESEFRDSTRLPAAFDRREQGGKTLVEVRNACAAVTAIAAPERLVLPPAEIAGMFAMLGSAEGEAGLIGVLGTGPTETVYEVKRGASITWEDGRAAGQVVADHTFDRPPVDASGRSCFALEVDKDSLVLCFAAADVHTTTRVSPGSLGGGLFGELAEGSGGLGAIGSASKGGEGGLGLGATSKSKVRLGSSVVKGTLDKDVIRRIIRRRIDMIRSCYEKQLAAEPTLEGRITIKFTISESGSVAMVEVAEDTLGSPDVAGCVKKTIKGMKFPAPEGGVVDVSYPFTFVPG